MPKSLDFEWTPERKLYRDAEKDLTTAEARQPNLDVVRVRFYDDHAEIAIGWFGKETVEVATWDAADYLVLAVHQDATRRAA